MTRRFVPAQLEAREHVQAPGELRLRQPVIRAGIPVGHFPVDSSPVETRRFLKAQRKEGTMSLFVPAFLCDL